MNRFHALLGFALLASTVACGLGQDTGSESQTDSNEAAQSSGAEDTRNGAVRDILPTDKHTQVTTHDSHDDGGVSPPAQDGGAPGTDSGTPKTDAGPTADGGNPTPPSDPDAGAPDADVPDTSTPDGGDKTTVYP